MDGSQKYCVETKNPACPICTKKVSLLISDGSGYNCASLGRLVDFIFFFKGSSSIIKSIKKYKIKSMVLTDAQREQNQISLEENTLSPVLSEFPQSGFKNSKHGGDMLPEQDRRNSKRQDRSPKTADVCLRFYMSTAGHTK